MVDFEEMHPRWAKETPRVRLRRLRRAMMKDGLLPPKAFPADLRHYVGRVKDGYREGHMLYIWDVPTSMHLYAHCPKPRFAKKGVNVTTSLHFGLPIEIWTWSERHSSGKGLQDRMYVRSIERKPRCSESK